MPFVTITLHEGKTPEYLRRLSSLIHDAMLETLVFSPDVLYHVMHEVKPGNMVHLPDFRGMKRSGDVVCIQMTLKSGRTAEQKRAMYERVTHDLHAQLGMRRQDVIIIVTENSADDWFWGMP